jgi:SAM-dependent methyltransferase
MSEPLERDEHARWQVFYADRARPCPFFVLAPDESLSEWIAQGLIEPGRALDVGCGNARNAIFLARHGFGVQAVDLSASAVAWARDEVAKAQVAMDVQCASVFDLHLAAGSYDLVYDGGCFHHMPPHRRDAYVRLVAGALRPGGTLALVCFTPEGGSGLTDDEVYQRQSLGGGLGYDEARLREIWGRDFQIDTLRRMREQPPGSALFGRDFLWVIRARRR